MSNLNSNRTSVVGGASIYGGTLPPTNRVAGMYGGSFAGSTIQQYPSIVDGSLVMPGMQAAAGYAQQPLYPDVIVETMQTEVYESVNKIEDFDSKNEENLNQMANRLSLSSSNIT